MIEIIEEGGGLWAKYGTDMGRTSRVELTPYLLIRGWSSILRPIIRYIQRVSVRSRVNYLRTTHTLGRLLVQLGRTTLPSTESGWQDLVIELQESVLSDPNSRATLETRVEYILKTVNAFLRHLQEEGVMPIGVEIPTFAGKLEQVDYSKHLGGLIGSAEPKPVKEFPTKLLCGFSLSRTDAGYLDEVHVELLSRREVLRGVLVQYFRAMVAHAAWGRQAMRGIDPEAIVDRINRLGPRIDDKGKYHRNGKHYCAPSDPEGFRRFLALSYHLYRDLEPLPLRNDYLPRTSHVTDLSLCGLGDPFVGCDPTLTPGQIVALRLRWMLGLLTYADVAVLSALLIMDHPRFTPEAVTGARLIDSSGKLNLVLGDNSETFEVIKPRAKAVKREHLSDLGQEIIHFVIDYSRDKRAQLRADGNPIADLLFICKPHNRMRNEFSAVDHMQCVSFLSGSSKKYWLGKAFPRLIDAGLERGAVSFRKIRNTEGVLDWFKRGSIAGVSQTLGNKTKTVIAHYIPPPLLAAWNTRLVRRFQNLLISVAAAGEDFLLEATDFSSLSELHLFLTQMLSLHEPGSSPLADKLHRLFQNDAADMTANIGNASLSIAISKSTLAALYAYSDAATDAGLISSDLGAPDQITGIRPQQFIDLALLLRHSLPRDDRTDLRAAHAAAQVEAESLRRRLNWSQLMARKEHVPS